MPDQPTRRRARTPPSRPPRPSACARTRSRAPRGVELAVPDLALPRARHDSGLVSHPVTGGCSSVSDASVSPRTSRASRTTSCRNSPPAEAGCVFSFRRKTRAFPSLSVRRGSRSPATKPRRRGRRRRTTPRVSRAPTRNARRVRSRSREKPEGASGEPARPVPREPKPKTTTARRTFSRWRWREVARGARARAARSRRTWSTRV